MTTEFGGPPPFFIIFGGIVVLVVIFGFGYAIFGGVKTWAANNASPLITEFAKVIGKRTNVSGGAGDTSASTSYYVTFELRSGERIELPMSGRNFGLLIEGDTGDLTHQGTRFKGFERRGSGR